MNTHDISDQFCAEYGNETFDRLFEVIYGDAKDDRFIVLEQWYRDPINCYGSVVFYPTPDQEIIVNFTDGNSNGSVITSYGPEVNTLEEEAVATIVHLDEARLRAEGKSVRRARILWEAGRKYLAEDMARKYDYDRRFSTDNATRQYYQRWFQDHYVRTERIRIK